MPPSIDPLSHKNRDLSIHKLVGILVDAKLVPEHGPAIVPPFEHSAQRVQADGTLRPALATPLRLSRTPAHSAGPAPRLGADTATVLERVLGLDHDEVVRLTASGVVG